MPSAVPQTLWTEAGSTVALGSPRPHTWLHVTEVTLQSLRGHPRLPDLPPPTAPIAPDELHLSKTPLLCLADFHGGARGTCTRITKPWIFHTFSLKIIMLAFTDLGPGLSFVFPCPCSQSTQSVVKSQLTASIPLNLQAGQGHLFFAGPASPHSSVSPSL